MVCCGINSICPIHAFLLSRSVQATGGGSSWAVLPSVISKGYKLHYPAQSEPARTAPSIHPLFLCLPLSFSPNAASCGDLHLSSRPPSFPSESVIDGGCPLSLFRYLSMETHIKASKHKTHTAHAQSETATHTQTHTHSKSQGQEEATEGAPQV